MCAWASARSAPPSCPRVADVAEPASPARTAAVLRDLTIALLAAGALAVALITAGAFDPRPDGDFVQTDYPGKFDVAGGSEAIYPQDAPWPDERPPGRFSARLRTAQAGGELDSGYGLRLVGESTALTVAVSPLGYLAIWEESDAGGRQHLMPWQPWPHVRTDMQENEIWLDVVQAEGLGQADGRANVTAWVNRERLWQGEVQWPVASAALWQGSFGGPATVDFRQLEWFAAP